MPGTNVEAKCGDRPVSWCVHRRTRGAIPERVLTVSRRQLPLSTLLAPVRVSGRAALAAPIEPDYWPTQQWQTALPSSQGVDIDALVKADQMIRSSMPDVSGLLVVRNGYIVHEVYFGG